ncbi:hematopoietic prostaglandin D synthase isoform X2 [Tachyglossus aculeatus]|uniref:hematopoietic prostaglandin D synthase isoform X2 n=1 Tax=Tachyglossus aculeatus TaxID=9261 RepID=UPI0018F6A9E9|nr:hematopoietic prostaglandin D synthase isoform X2 [Tachyglossus aculeatus]
MPNLKLVYFNLRGRAEIIRYLFAYMDLKYEDQRIEPADWPGIKPLLPFGKIPILEVDGVILHQSLAIARYFAREAGAGIQQAARRQGSDVAAEPGGLPGGERMAGNLGRFLLGHLQHDTSGLKTHVVRQLPHPRGPEGPGANHPRHRRLDQPEAGDEAIDGLSLSANSLSPNPTTSGFYSPSLRHVKGPFFKKNGIFLSLTMHPTLI